MYCTSHMQPYNHSYSYAANRSLLLTLSIQLRALVLFMKVLFLDSLEPITWSLASWLALMILHIDSARIRPPVLKTPITQRRAIVCWESWRVYSLHCRMWHRRAVSAHNLAISASQYSASVSNTFSYKTLFFWVYKRSSRVSKQWSTAIRLRSTNVQLTSIAILLRISLALLFS